jgi:glucose-6-phosphate dehydrogenase assembly protein OpcA
MHTALVWPATCSIVWCMPLSSLTTETIARLGIEVPISRIDKALKELWGQDDGKTRASLINLAIYTENGDILAHDNDILDVITAEHACRALLILCDPAASPPRVRAWVQALCRPYQGKQVVCSEQITFVLEGGDAAQVQNIVFAHLDSDLPLIVWWQGDLTQNFEERLYSRVDTLIIDSARWQEPAAQFESLRSALDAETADFDVRDLAWTRSHFMRTALASCFQDAAALQNLSQLHTIRITHLSGQRITALFLAAWIMQRLKVTLRVDLVEKGTGPALQRLQLEGDGIQADICRDCDSRFIHVCATCGTHTHKELLPADVDSDGELLNEQLSRVGGSTLYSEILPIVRGML